MDDASKRTPVHYLYSAVAVVNLSNWLPQDRLEQKERWCVGECVSGVMYTSVLPDIESKPQACLTEIQVWTAV